MLHPKNYPSSTASGPYGTRLEAGENSAVDRRLKVLLYDDL